MLLDGIYLLSPASLNPSFRSKKGASMLYHTTSGMLVDSELHFDIKDEG